MSQKYIIVQITSGILIPLLMTFLGEALTLMIPWFIVMFTVVVADLVAGLWKSYKLQIPIRFSKACRETMGKMIVYFAFVCMACCINVADNGEFNWAKWLALLVIIIEVGSIVGNILKPHGVNISMNALVKAILNHSTLPLTCPEVDEIVVKEPIEKIRKEELEKQGEGDFQKPKKRKK